MPDAIASSALSSIVSELPPMNILYLLAGLIALALTGYLCVALLKPEWFE